MGGGGLGPALVVVAGALGVVAAAAAAAIAAAAVVVVAVAGGHGEAVLAVGSWGASSDRGLGLDRRGGWLTEGRVQMLVSAEL